MTNVAWAPDGSPIYYDRPPLCRRGSTAFRCSAATSTWSSLTPSGPKRSLTGACWRSRLNSNHEWQLFRFWPATGQVQDLPVAAVDAGKSLANPRAFPDGKEALVDGAPLGKEADGMRLLVVDLATGATRPLAPGLPRGTGAPDFAVSRDGKSVLITQEFGEFTRVISVPAHGRGTRPNSVYSNPRSLGS